MLKYEWYFVNKNDDVFKNVTNKITFIIPLFVHSNHLTLFTVPNLFIIMIIMIIMIISIIFN